MIKDFKDKVGVVTGAASGVGRSIALALAREGMKLTIVDVNREKLDRVSKEIEDIGVEVMGKIVDVGNREQMAQLADDVYERFGRVNLLCNNAGVIKTGNIWEINLENWDFHIDINLYGVIYGVHFFLKRMMSSNEECHIVNTSSLSGLVSSAEECIYCATKQAVVGLSEALSQQLQRVRSKVGVSVLYPHFATSNIFESSDKLADEKDGIYQDPEEIRKIKDPAKRNYVRRNRQGTNPDVVAQMMINSIQENRLHIIQVPDTLQFVEMRLNEIKQDAIKLDNAMREQGVVKDETRKRIHTDPNYGFSITYPADWVVQDPTPKARFVFRAISNVNFPDVTVQVSEAPESALNESVPMLAAAMSRQFGAQSNVNFATRVRLKDDTPAMEGEVELTLPNSNQLTYLVLIAARDNKLVSVLLGAITHRYDDVMKQRLKEVAYSLTF